MFGCVSFQILWRATRVCERNIELIGAGTRGNNLEQNDSGEYLSNHAREPQ
jgi:hypothetical protein